MSGNTGGKPAAFDELDSIINGLELNVPDAGAAGQQKPAIAPAATSGFDMLDGMLDALQDGRMSIRPGALNQQLGPTSAPAPSMGPAATGARGISGGRGISSGPGAAFAKGGISSGPGANRGGVVSAGPGAAFLAKKKEEEGKDVTIKMAEYTPDGRKIIATGPPCAKCGQMVLGKITNAVGKTWHPAHFTCSGCDQPFKDGQFLEHEDKPYCENCYWDKISPKCVRCSLPIKEKMVSWHDKVYHSDHFSCVGCGTVLTGGKHKEWESEPYCLGCFKERERWIQPAAHMCARCKKPIFGEYLQITGEYFHPEHFKCEACGIDLYNGNCHEYDGKNYCEEDYRKLLKHICFGCRKPIAGRSLTAMGRVWHNEHFVCAACHEPFAGSNFFEHEGKPYCDTHYALLFAQVCAKCEKPVIGNTVFALTKYWHAACYLCHYCSKPLQSESVVMEWEGKGMCRPCYFKLPKEVRDKYEKQKDKAAKAAAARAKEDERDRKKNEKELAKLRKAEMQAQGNA